MIYEIRIYGFRDGIDWIETLQFPSVSAARRGWEELMTKRWGFLRAELVIVLMEEGKIE